MNVFVSPTDHAWYTFLRERLPDEVNFWRPSGTKTFNALEQGEPFLFKAKAPHNAIIGGGWFARFVRAPVSLAWQAFGENNGVPDVRTFLARVRQYRRDTTSPDPEVGCILINEPFWFPEPLWLDAPSDWSREIVSGKRYDTTDAIGARLWDAVVQRLADPRAIIGPDARSATGNDLSDTPLFPAGPSAVGPRYGRERLIASRLGQGGFRLSVLDAYQRRCAITGERITPVLEAAHIKPYAYQGPHAVSNGLLLRSDLHRLFDLGYVSVDPDYRFLVSSRLQDEFHNGKDYYELAGSRLAVVPERQQDLPDKGFLQWHNEAVFHA